MATVNIIIVNMGAVALLPRTIQSAFRPITSKWLGECLTPAEKENHNFIHLNIPLSLEIDQNSELIQQQLKQTIVGLDYGAKNNREVQKRMAILRSYGLTAKDNFCNFTVITPN
ncbi:hypothetical protein DSO57_1014541 [Entomophthora muscae]|uniref:Uncharacterized protein n=1 Tax=Entomophthora muscae TaxID=34485 RepID=A0ACC2U3G7_9FUNG|nr:hypothetical protein DSO57_1014541 [Entomophthora muscae]